MNDEINFINEDSVLTESFLNPEGDGRIEKKYRGIGGRGAGMMAAYAAAKSGAQVTLYEKNEKLGKKIYITGKGALQCDK